MPKYDGLDVLLDSGGYLAVVAPCVGACKVGGYGVGEGGDEGLFGEEVLG